MEKVTRGTLTKGAKKLRDLFSRNEIKQVDFAILSGVGQANLSRYVNGVGVPHLRHYVALEKHGREIGIVFTPEDFLTPATDEPAEMERAA